MHIHVFHQILSSIGLIMKMERYYFYSVIFYLLCLASIVSSETYYINKTWQLPNNEDSDNHLTLSQFINNSSAYLTNDTRLVFAGGNYSLESKLIVENVDTFFMSSETIPTSRAARIICNHNARFDFRRVKRVTVSGFDFVGCSENHIEFVGLLQLENSNFKSTSIENAYSTQLVITGTNANIDRVTFTYVENDQTQNGSHIDTVIFVSESAIVFTHSWFKGYNVRSGQVLHSENGCNITIFNTTFVNIRALDYYAWPECHHAGIIVYANESNVHITNSKFVNNIVCNLLYTVNTNMSSECVIDHCNFLNNSIYSYILFANNTIMRIGQSDFLYNTAGAIVHAITYESSGVNELVIDHCNFLNNSIDSCILFTNNTIMRIRQSDFLYNMATYIVLSITYESSGVNELVLDHCNFLNNSGYGGLLFAYNTITRIRQSKFIENKAYSLVSSSGDIFTMTLNEFINNSVSAFIILIASTTAENVTNNVFIDNIGLFDIFIYPYCRPNYCWSMGSSCCIECNEKWIQNLVGIVIASLLAGIALVIFMLALNMTVAVGTLNGILFYANVVAARADTYFFPFKTHTFVTVFISWLNLDIGFDVCLFKEMNVVHKALIQLAFPTYIIILVVVVIVASECSSRFAKIIGKGNPVAVLATMIFLSYVKFFNAILESFSLLYLQAAYGSRSRVHVNKLGNAFDVLKTDPSLKIAYFWIVISILLLILCITYTALVFSWQWLLYYQHKAIFKWVRYQKLCHFLEPNHAPYTPKHRYWTGLLLIIRVLLFLSSLLNFSLDA